ncbi:replication initiation protein [Citrobacter portucalensis]|uniref:replication initiation protein n=1 Tax=Citrobacter portucalensis TaxID=1639133 RepID=UPI00226BAD45|nr:replication initiation protein [Citrobacter portucalensis]MCX9019079.1 replication initiation protein [Citrobacter portucalensis]
MPKKSATPPANVASSRPLLNSVYSVKIPAKRVLLMCLADLNKRKESDKDCPIFVITAAAYRELYGVPESNACREVARGVKELHDTSVFFPRLDGDYKYREVKWLHAIDHTDRGTVNAAHRITIHPDVMPYLRSLESGFAKFDLKDVKGLSSTNQVRLYEDLTLNKDSAGKSWVTSIDDIAERYKLTPSLIASAANFKRKFLDSAVAAINESTPLNITYIANGRNLKFFIEERCR